METIFPGNYPSNNRVCIRPDSMGAMRIYAML